MKKCTLIVIGLLLLGIMAANADIITPLPPYPLEARIKNITGTGKCLVRCDAQGGIAKAVMIESTGSKLLDENTVIWAKKHWSGPPNSTDTVPVSYVLTASKPVNGATVYYTPAPSYPYLARREHLTGFGAIRVNFDARGIVTNAFMVKSTGNTFLDANTVNFAKARWHAKYNKPTTITVPVCYASE